MFRSIPEQRGRRWYWVEQSDFDIADHVTYTRLPGEGSREDAEAHISGRMSVQLPADQPLWSLECIENYRGFDDEEADGDADDTEGALLLFRVQHGLVDGVRLTQLILNLFDLSEDALPPKVGKDLAPRGGLLRIATGAGAGVVRDAMGIARGLGGAAVAFPWTVPRVVKDVAAPGFQVNRVPTRLVESLSRNVEPTNMTANTYRALFRLLWEPRSPKRSWSGSPQAEKKVSWVSGIDLEAVKRVATVHGSTVTVVMTAAVARALTTYLEEVGDRPLADINIMIPMSVAPVGEGAPDTLGNHITLILLRLPLGVEDSQELIDEITTSMTRVQYSFEPHATYAAILASSMVPGQVSSALIDVAANRTIGQLTSVPGPTKEVSLGGSPVKGVLGWVPMTGQQSLGICIYSYAGKVSVGIATDAELVPEPGILAHMIEEQFETFDGWEA